jgi:hypothetical protein
MMRLTYPVFAFFLFVFPGLAYQAQPDKAERAMRSPVAIDAERSIQESGDHDFWTEVPFERTDLPFSCNQITLQTPSLTAADIKDAVWDGSRYIAVGRYGTLLISNDGENWTRLPFQDTHAYLSGITYGDFGYVIAADTKIFHSLDGVNWSLVQTFPKTGLRSVAWNGERYVAAGVSFAAHAIAESTDGVNWNPVNVDTPSTLRLNSIEWLNGRFMAVGSNGVLMTSHDGLQWEITYFDSAHDLYSVAWNGSHYFISAQHRYSIPFEVGQIFDGFFYVSDDATEWRVKRPWPTRRTNRLTALGNHLLLLGESDADGAGGIAISEDKKLWHQVQTTANAIFADAAWNGSRFVAVGQAGHIETSDDGELWTPRSSGITENLSGVIWTGAQFVAVGDAGCALTSPAGVVWTKQNTGIVEDLYAVEQGSGLLVASGRGGGLITSTDAVSWVQRDSATHSDILDILWDGARFMTTGRSGSITQSADGANWSAIDTPYQDTLIRITWNGSQYLAKSDAYNFYTSTDGIHWEAKGFSRWGASDVLWHQDEYLVVIKEPFQILTSPDTIYWSSFGADLLVGLISDDNDNLIGATNSREVLTSSDGLTWSFQTLVKDTEFINGQLASNGSNTILFGGRGFIFNSDDLLNWTLQGNGFREYFRTVTFADGRFLAGNSNGKLFSSLDGVSWEQTSSFFPWFQVDQIAYNDGRWILLDRYGKAITSTDLVTWDLIPNTFDFEVMVDGGGKWIFFQFGKALVSEDGITWQSYTMAPDTQTTFYALDALWDGNQFVVLNEDWNGYPRIFTSPDGMVWDEKELPETRLFYENIAWNGQRYIAGGRVDTLLVSDDAETWTLLEDPPGFLSSRVIDSVGNTFIAGPYSGGILTSEDGSTWRSVPLNGAVSGMASNQETTVFSGTGIFTSLCPPCFTQTDLDDLIADWGEVNTMEDLVFAANTPCE